MSLRTRRSAALVAALLVVATACQGAPASQSPAAGTTAPAPTVTGTTAPATGTAGTPAAESPTPGAESPTPGAESPTPGAESPTPGAESPTPGAESPTPGAEGADFRFVVDSEPTTLAGSPDDLPTSWIVGFLYSTLYQPNYKLEYVPFLAEGDPDISEDGLTWNVKIKQGVKFHDGSDLTAEDVAFSYRLLKSPNCRENPDSCSSISDNVESIEVVDPQTVRFVLKQKYAPFLSSGLGSVLIRPKAAVEASFARFQEAAGAVTPAESKALVDKVAAATATQDAEGNPTACVPAEGAEAPATCQYATYTEEMTAILEKAKIALPAREQFNVGGESGTDFDPEAYAQALFGSVTDLNNAQSAQAVDRIAAALRIMDFANKPIGSGPYKFVEYKAGQHVEMARHEQYFGGTTGVNPTGIPARAFAVVIRETGAATAALANDDIQWQQKIESDAYKEVANNPNLQLAEYADNGYYYIAFNLRQGHPYADKKLRQAFSMCIQHDETVEVATEGNGQPVYANTPPFSWAFNPDVPKYTHDVAAAKALIEEAGYTMGADNVYAKDGKKLNHPLYVRIGRPQRIKFAELARDQLAECGIKISIVPGDLNTVLIPKVLDYPNEFDLYLGGWSTSLDPDDYSIFHSSEIPTAEVTSANNFPGWKNDEADRLLAAGRQELDQEKRKQIYFEFQKLIHDELPYYFLWADLAHTGLSKRVTSQNEPFDLTSVGINYYNTDAWTVAAR